METGAMNEHRLVGSSVTTGNLTEIHFSVLYKAQSDMVYNSHKVMKTFTRFMRSNASVKYIRRCDGHAVTRGLGALAGS